ncbi:hypothetical protein ACQ3HE_12380 [Plantibacter auratus]|uniref:hypothetical protein n=1 Tax=Plantibacter auratus TaxID=272914 RepID=UPI003D33804F
MTEPQPPLQFALSTAHLDDEIVAGALRFLFNEHQLAVVLLKEIMTLMPDPSLWRLTVTGDVIKSVNEIEQRTDGDSYTTDRGAGRVGARTIAHADGTFALAVAAHLALHEAGHALLHVRHEDANATVDLVDVNETDQGWRHYVAAHVDDYRIEAHTTRHAPSPFRHAMHLESAIKHLRDELNAARRSWREDIDAALRQTMSAANDMFRVMAYLAAELGSDDQGRPNRPDPVPEGWQTYLETVGTSGLRPISSCAPSTNQCVRTKSQ